MNIKKTSFIVMFLALCLVSCASKEEKKTFAEAHDEFETKLVKLDRDNDEIPAPPEGVFDLVKYPSEVGDLAAYISSDPDDGQKHPLIIWVVGGWGNGIDGFPWSYPYWDNDQTASAFWRAGVLTMYPSFRGGSGNPGNYETLFGEVDDIVAACKYAETLPYVDPDRIYLGGHSTGGTRALLTAEYTDRFRAVFCFGAVDEIKYHNNSQFTFDTSNQEEFVMRSPIHWLEDVKTPTFLIEGIDGNSARMKAMQEKSDNENIKYYIIDGADHFSVLAPVTELLAQKILNDTGKEINLSITQEELQKAMKNTPEVPMPVMAQYVNETLGLSLSYPFIWEAEEEGLDGGGLRIYLNSADDGDNVWDMASMTIDRYSSDMPDYMDKVEVYLQSEGYELHEVDINGYTSLAADGLASNQSGTGFVNKVLIIPKDGSYLELNFYIHESFGDEADPLFQEIADSIVLSQ